MRIVDFFKKFYFEIIIFIILLVMFKTYLPVWFSEWSNVDSPYAFAFFIFGFFAYFIKANYENLSNIPKNRDYRGVLLLIAGMFLYIGGLKTDISYMASLSLPVFIWGIVFTLYGPKLFKKLLIPLILFTFAFPFFPIRRLTFPLQNMSAYLTSGVLNVLGINSYSEGSLVTVGQCKLAIVAGCSGLKSLSTYFFTSIIFTFFMNTKKYLKVLFVLFTIPLSIVMNVLRLSVVGLYSVYYGYNGLEKFHDDLGIVIAVISVTIMVFVAKGLEVKGENNES